MTKKHICMDVNFIIMVPFILLTITLLVHRIWFHSFLAVDAEGGNGLQFEKNGRLFFKFLLCILEKKWLKTDCSLFLLTEIISCFPPGALRTLNFKLERRFLVKN